MKNDRSPVVRTGWSFVAMMCAVLTAGMAGCGRDAGTGARVVEKSGGFSYVAPQDWKKHRVPGIDFFIVAGEARNGVQPSIFFVKEMSDEPMDSYISGFMEHRKREHPNLALSAATNVVISDQGFSAVMLDASRNKEGTVISSRFFFFQDGRKKIVVTCTAPAEAWASCEPYFRATIKSFRFER